MQDAHPYAEDRLSTSFYLFFTRHALKVASPAVRQKTVPFSKSIRAAKEWEGHLECIWKVVPLYSSSKHLHLGINAC